MYESQCSNTKAVTYFFHKTIRLNVQDQLRYTFDRRFSVFGYFYPNTGINQLELVNESHHPFAYRAKRDARVIISTYMDSFYTRGD